VNGTADRQYPGMMIGGIIIEDRKSGCCQFGSTCKSNDDQWIYLGLSDDLEEIKKIK